MTERESWYERYPDYRVELKPSEQRVEARFGAELIAGSDDALIVVETNHEPVTYFPLADVRLEYLEATDHHTFCPFKGEASYWTLTVKEQVADNVMWAYEDPFPEVAGLKGYAAFYGDRVSVATAD